MSVTRTITGTEMRDVNRSAILDIIRNEGPIARSEIANQLKVSLPTVMRIVDELIADSFVQSTGTKEITGGRKRELLEFNAEQHLTIGINLNQTCLHGAVVDLAGNFLIEKNLPNNGDKGIEVYDKLIQLISDLIGDAEKTGKIIRGIGLGAPGITYKVGEEVQWVPSLDWRDFPLKQRLQNTFHLPIFFDNDVNLSALAEMWFGAGKHLRNLVLLIISEGIGAGIIIDNAVYRGSHLTAGEVGFLIPDRKALDHQWHGIGAIESLAGIPGITKRGDIALKALSPMSNHPELALEDIFKAYKNGEAWSVSVVEETYDYLAQIVAAVGVCFDPDIIVIHGKILAHAEDLISPIIKRLEGRIPILPKLVPSKLGHHSILLGAAVNVLYNTSDFFVVRKLT